MKRKIGIGICLVCVLLTVAFIFYNSAQPVPEWQKASASVAETIVSVAPNGGASFGSWTSFVNYIRKAAHALEFFVLGTELSLLFFAVLQKRGVQAVWNVLTLALLTAVTDESIQILSGRGPRVQDVLLDFAGSMTAVLLILLLCCIVCFFQKNARIRKRGNTDGNSD